MKNFYKKIINKKLKKETKPILKFIGYSLITFGLGYLTSKKKQKIKVLGDLNIIKPPNGDPFSLYLSLKNGSNSKIMHANNGEDVSFKVNNIIVDKDFINKRN